MFIWTPHEDLQLIIILRSPDLQRGLTTNYKFSNLCIGNKFSPLFKQLNETAHMKLTVKRLAKKTLWTQV